MEEKIISFGEIAGPTIGLVMREAVRRAIVAINSVRFNFESTPKPDKEDGSKDFYTSADLAAQRAIIKLLRKNFPQFGIVAEEENLSVPCTHSKHDIWFTVDPLDGTKAFMRKQSHGVGVMISLICDGEIIAAYVGDVNTGEIYGFRPGSENVWRITRADTPVQLEINQNLLLSDQYVLLTDPPDEYSELIQRLVKKPKDGGLFKGLEVFRGSIGVLMARLWKGEVGGVILRPHTIIPWDICPVLGICEKLGFIFLSIDPVNKEIISRKIVPSRQNISFELETIVVHENCQKELTEYLKKC